MGVGKEEREREGGCVGGRRWLTRERDESKSLNVLICRFIFAEIYFLA